MIRIGFEHAPKTRMSQDGSSSKIKSPSVRSASHESATANSTPAIELTETLGEAGPPSIHDLDLTDSRRNVTEREDVPPDGGKLEHASICDSN